MNRKFTITGMFFLFFTLALAGCSGQQTVLPQSDIPFTIEGEIEQRSEDYLDLDLQIPSLSGFQSGPDINALILEAVETARAGVYAASNGMSQQMSTNMKASLYCRYGYGYYEEIGSLYLDLSSYTGGDHGQRWLISYNFDTETGAFLTLPQFLQHFNLTDSEEITEAIISQLEASTAQYYENAADTIRSRNGDLPFYISSDQQLVIYFPAETVAPYSTGIPTFIFSEGGIL